MSKFKRFNNSFERYLNLFKVTGGFLVSSMTGKDHLCGMPYAASMEPANFCSLRCAQCPTGLGNIEKERVTLDMERYKRTIDALTPELLWLNLYFQGEPFLNKNLHEMVRYASERGITTSISTNGHFLTEERVLGLKNAGLSRLIVSLDGATEDSYSKYRIGGSFRSVIVGIKNAVKAGLKVELQCLLLSSTENEIEQVRKLGKELGVWRVKFKSAQFYSQDTLMPQNAKLSRYIPGTLILKRKLRNRCWRVATSVVISATGEILPCCFDKDCSNSYGNLFNTDINKNALREILHSQKASDFRTLVFQNRRCISICTNCTE